MPFLSDADASVFKNVYMDGFLDVSSQLIVRGNLRVENTEIHLGTNAGATSQGENSVAIGNSAGFDNQGKRCVAIGPAAGVFGQGDDSIAIGRGTFTGVDSIAIGHDASATSIRSIAIGKDTTANGNESIAIGDGASTSTFTNAVAIGNGATATANGDFVLGNNLMILRQGNFRAFKPVHNDNGGGAGRSFAGVSLVRTLATGITFNGGELVVICNTSAVSSVVNILGTLTLKCFNSSNVLQWTLTMNQFFIPDIFHLAFGNTISHTGIPAQTEAYLQLERNTTNIFQNFNDFTNVLIIELPLS